MAVRYHNLVYDSSRWDGFRFRPDDIVISTPEARVAELVAPDLAAWAHHGWLGAPSLSQATPAD